MSKIKKDGIAAVNLENEAEQPDSSFKVTLQKPSKIKSYLDVMVQIYQK